MCIYLAGNVSGEDKEGGGEKMEKNRKLKENVDLTENIYLFPFILAKKNNLFDFLGWRKNWVKFVSVCVSQVWG